MSRRPLAPLLVVAALLLGSGVALALAVGGGEADPAPPAATADVPGVVSVGRPITPYRAGRPATGQIEMRVKNPTAGRASGILFHRYEKTRKGRRMTFNCFEYGPERVLRRYPTSLGGSCQQTDPVLREPWSVTIGPGSEGSIVLTGSVTDEVARLTVAGPGGTLVVPRSEHGGFVVLYSDEVVGRAVLTARLRDGSTIYRRTRLPPSRRPDGAAVARDPGGLPDWFTNVSARRGGARDGQTCLQVLQDDSTRAARSNRFGWVSLAPVCGDLRRAPVFARTVELRPSDRLSTFSPGPDAPRRTILAGVAGRGVRIVALEGPSGIRELPISPAGRAFLVVFPASVKTRALTLRVTLADGTVRRFPNPTAVNRATSRKPTPSLRGPVGLRRTPAGGRRVRLTARLTSAPERFEITFLGREVRMRRVPGSADRFAGIYDGDRGVRRPIVSGRVYGFSVLLCGDVCNVTLAQARLR